MKITLTLNSEEISELENILLTRQSSCESLEAMEYETKLVKKLIRKFENTGMWEK